MRNVSDQQILQHLRTAAAGADFGALSEVSLKGVAKECGAFVEDVERVYRAAIAAEQVEQAGKGSAELRGMIDSRDAGVGHGGRAEYGGIPFGPWNVDRAPASGAGARSALWGSSREPHRAAEGGAPEYGGARGANGVLAQGTAVATIPAEVREKVARFANDIAEDPLTRMALEVLLLREMTEKGLALPPAKGSWKPAGKLVNEMELDWNKAQRALVAAGLWHPKHHISAREFEAKTGESPSEYVERYLTQEMSGADLIRSRITHWGEAVAKRLAEDPRARSAETLGALKEAIARRGVGRDVDLAVQALAHFPLEQTFPILMQELQGPRRDAALVILGGYAHLSKHPMAPDHQLFDPRVRTKVEDMLGRALYEAVPPHELVMAGIDLLHTGTVYRGSARALLEKAIGEQPRRAWNQEVLEALVDRVATGATAKDEAFLDKLSAALTPGSAAKVRADGERGRIEGEFQELLTELRSARHRSELDGRSETMAETIGVRFADLNPKQAVRFAEALSELAFDQGGDLAKWKIWPGDVAFAFGRMANLSAAMPLGDAERAQIGAAIDRLARSFEARVQLPNSQAMASDVRPVFVGLFDRLKDAPWGRAQAKDDLAEILRGSVIDKVVGLTDIETLAYVDGIRGEASRAQLSDEDRATLRANVREIYDYWGWPAELLPMLRARAEELAASLS